MLSLLIFLPFALLVLAALGIVILQQVRPSIGYAWLISALAGGLAISAALFLRLRLPMQVTWSQWRLFGERSSPPSFLLDYSSWPYVFCVVTMALAFILTDAARLETEARPYNWALGLSLAALGSMAVMAANPVTLVFIWTGLDLVEFIMVMSTGAGRRMGAQTVTAFSVRVAGTLLVILAILFARSQSIPFELVPIPENLAIFMLLAAGMRLGVLPLNLPYTREVYTWQGLSNVMRMIGPASSLMVLGRMPVHAVPEQWKGVFLGLSALAAVYGAGMWLTADSERNARPYWIISLAALGVASVTNGNPNASIAWGVALLLTGSVLFYFSSRRRVILFIPLLGVLGITGLPYSPAAAGWLGIAGRFSGMFNGLFLLAVVLLIWGYIRHALRPREELYRLERWVHTVYPIGLAALILAQWGIAVFGWPGSFSVGVWWASAIVVFIAALGVVLAFSLRSIYNNESVTGRWVGVFARRVGGAVSAVFRLNWLYSLIAAIYRLAQNIIQLLTEILEGDGGILWSLVMLALLISLIWTGGSR